MLDSGQITEISHVVEQALDKAERIWQKHGIALNENFRATGDSLEKYEKVPSRIPGRPNVEAGKEEVGTFIALVADMRESNQHLMAAISGTKASELERVFYETSALLPAMERTIQFKQGAVTEYLGDGVLALFSVDEDEPEAAIRASFGAAENCLSRTRKIVNDALSRRYGLPRLAVGIGLAMSKAVISLVGLEGNSHAKVTGRCVYFATKLSGGVNEIAVDKVIRSKWPKSKGGELRFKSVTRRNTEGYLVSRED